MRLNITDIISYSSVVSELEKKPTIKGEALLPPLKMVLKQYYDLSRPRTSVHVIARTHASMAPAWYLALNGACCALLLS